MFTGILALWGRVEEFRSYGTYIVPIGKKWEERSLTAYRDDMGG